MAYHVELKRGMRVARAFNLDRDALRRNVLEPWTTGRTFTLGEREWEPASSALRILEGPVLSTAELGVGQGWSNAERAGTDVTRALVLEASAAARADRAVAVLAESPAAEAAAVAQLDALGLRRAPWGPLRAAILTRNEPAEGLPHGVLIVFAERPSTGGEEAGWWLDVGLALGAFGPLVVVALPPDRATPAAIRDAGAVTLDPARPEPLRDRLARAGFAA